MIARWLFKNFQRRLWILLSVGCVAAAGSFLVAKPLLFVERGPRTGDVIVVLGGEPGERLFKALELYKAGAAPRILLTGRGDNEFMQRRLLLAGVPAEAILREPDSRSTQENAEFSVALLARLGLKRAILVTSWYHSRRALACFTHYGKDLEFASAPAYGLYLRRIPPVQDAVLVWMEYVKIGVYIPRHGIWPNFFAPASRNNG